MVYGKQGTLCIELDAVRVIKKNRKIEVAGTLLWNARTGSLQKGTRRVKLRWLESVEKI